MIKFELCKNAITETRLPERSSKHSAGYDFFTPVDITIAPNETKMILTHVKAQMDSDKVLLILPRSSMGIKRHVVLANSTGVIDADYYNNPDNEGNIGIVLYNYGTEVQKFKTGDKVAQGIFVNYCCTNDDVATAERIGGIGSTGK